MARTQVRGIGELLDYLARWDPAALGALRVQYPHIDLRGGEELGSESIAAGEVEVRVRISVALSALDRMANEAPRALRMLMARIRRLNGWSQLTQMLSLFGAGGTVATLLAQRYDYAMVPAVLSVIASMIGVVVAWLKKDEMGNDDQLINDYSALAAASYRATLPLELLKVAERDPKSIDPPRLHEVLNEANDLAYRMQEILTRFDQSAG